MKYLNLGSGGDYRYGWVNLDLYAPKADVRHDLEKFPWPFMDDAFDHVRANQVFEHLPDRLEGNDGLVRVLQECHRVLKPGGLMHVGTPHVRDHRNQYSNFTHRRQFIPETLQTMDPCSRFHDPVVAYQAGVAWHVQNVHVVRRLRVTRWFDSHYHPQKHLGVKVNVGRPYGIEWLLRKGCPP